jgi:hypothetical protein
MTISEYMEDFYMAKIDIETKLIEQGKIKERRPLQEFITEITTNQCVYMHGKHVIPFTMLPGKSDNYLIYTYDDKNDKHSFNDLHNKLKVIEYDLTRLKKVPQMDLLTVDLNNDTFFILDGNYYRI